MNDQNKKNKNIGLGIRFQVAIIVLFISVMAINFIWTYQAEKEEIVEIATEKAEIIIREYLAAIEFSIEKSEIAYDDRDSENVHKRVISLGEAGKQFSELLSLIADFNIGMVSNLHRNPDNTPDMYEKAALSKFERTSSLQKVYKQIMINKRYHLRYIVPLRITKSCLPCHGEPKGDIDATGYKKEGYKLGDVRGAISLTIPIYTEYKHRMRHFIDLIIFYFIITSIAVFVSYYILRNMINLNKQIQDKNILLNKQHETLKQYEKEKANLIEMIVHDLKNPLTTIISGLEIVLMSNALQEERLSSSLNLSYSGAKRLSGMISDILDVSAMESRRFTPKKEVVDIKQLITKLFDELKMALAKRVKSLELVIEGEFPPFELEPNLLQRIIENLVFNAVKHSHPRQAQIKTTVEYLDYSDEVLISISDHGEGIAKENIDKIFEKFFQVEEQKRSSCNKGLGLTFCKYAVNIMGGKIWVESEIDKGTTFFFTLKNGYNYIEDDET